MQHSHTRIICTTDVGQSPLVYGWCLVSPLRLYCMDSVLHPTFPWTSCRMMYNSLV